MAKRVREMTGLHLDLVCRQLIEVLCVVCDSTPQDSLLGNEWARLPAADAKSPNL